MVPISQRSETREWKNLVVSVTTLIKMLINIISIILEHGWLEIFHFGWKNLTWAAICFILENAAGHAIDTLIGELNNVTILFIFLDSTTHAQAMNARVIWNFKLYDKNT